MYLGFRSSILVLCTSLLIISSTLLGPGTGCGGSGGGGEDNGGGGETPAITSEQAGEIGNATLDVATNTLTSVLNGEESLLTLGGNPGTLASPSPDISVTSATECTATTVSSCESPSSTFEISLAGDSGSCAGTIAVCDSDRIVTLTCTDFVSGGVTLNGTITISVSGLDSCEITSAMAASLTGTVDGVSCDVSLAYSTSVADNTLTMTGCMTACGSGYDMTTSVPFTAACEPEVECPSADDPAAYETIFDGDCNFTPNSTPDENSTFDYTITTVAAAQQGWSDRVGCLFNAACLAGDRGCVKMTTVASVAEGCGLDMGGGGDDGGGDPEGGGSEGLAGLTVSTFDDTGVGFMSLAFQAPMTSDYFVFCTIKDPSAEKYPEPVDKVSGLSVSGSGFACTGGGPLRVSWDDATDGMVLDCNGGSLSGFGYVDIDSTGGWTTRLPNEYSILEGMNYQWRCYASNNSADPAASRLGLFYDSNVTFTGTSACQIANPGNPVADCSALVDQPTCDGSYGIIHQGDINSPAKYYNCWWVEGVCGMRGSAFEGEGSFKSCTGGVGGTCTNGECEPDEDNGSCPADCS